MDLKDKIRLGDWLGDQELMYTILCTGIGVSLIFWPLLNSLLCIALFVYWMVFSKKKVSPKNNDVRWVILFSLLFFVSVAGMLYTEDLKQGVTQLQKKSALLLFPLIFGLSGVITDVVFKRIFQAFAVSTFLGCIFGLINGIYLFFKDGTTNHLYGYNLVLLKNMSPFILGLCCLLSFLYLASKMLETRSKGLPLKKYNIIIAAFLFLFLFLLGNRTLLVSMSAFFVFFCYKLTSRAIHRLLLVASLGLFFLLAVRVNPYLNSQWHDLTDFSQQNNIQLDKDETLGRPWGGKTLRLSIWTCSWDIIKKYPIMGVGTGDVQNALQDAYERRKFYFASRYNTYNAHNQYIQETVGHGLIGLLIFLSGIFLPLIMCLKNKNNRLYALFLLCFIVMCLTESMLELNKGIIWYSFFNSIFIFKKP